MGKPQLLVYPLHGGFRRKATPVKVWVIWHRSSLTSERRGSGEATAHVHGGDGVPDAVLVRRVVQALHGAEPGATVVASDHVNPIVEGHCGDVTPFPCNVLFETHTHTSVVHKSEPLRLKKTKHEFLSNTYRKEAPFLCFRIIFFNYVYWWLLAAEPSYNQQDFFGTWKHPEISVWYTGDMHVAKLLLKTEFLPNLACVRGPCISLLSSGLKWNFLASSTRSRHGRLHRMRG